MAEKGGYRRFTDGNDNGCKKFEIDADIAEAMKWYVAAANVGNEYAQKRLNELFGN